MKYFLPGQPLVPQSWPLHCSVSVNRPLQVPKSFSSTVLTRVLCFEPSSPQVFEQGLQFVVLCQANYFEKCSWISQKNSEFFSTFSKLKKTIIFHPDLSKITILIKIWHNFPLKLQKTVNFSRKKPQSFKTFGAFNAENLELYVSKLPTFLELGSPMRRWSPPKLYSVLY